MFSMNSCEKTMENIGLANVFHEFAVFQRISWDQPGDSLENQKFMENIGLANVFREFVVFQRISWDQPGI